VGNEKELPRIIAVFHPQAWVNNYAVEVDPEGETEADLTDFILNMKPNKRKELIDEDYSSDDLRHAPEAPLWWGEWSGPFYVEVKESMDAYFDAIASEKGA
jgi:hypothetical protein